MGQKRKREKTIPSKRKEARISQTVDSTQPSKKTAADAHKSFALSVAEMNRNVDFLTRKQLTDLKIKVDHLGLEIEHAQEKLIGRELSKEGIKILYVRQELNADPFLVLVRRWGLVIDHRTHAEFVIGSGKSIRMVFVIHDNDDDDDVYYLRVRLRQGDIDKSMQGDMLSEEDVPKWLNDCRNWLKDQGKAFSVSGELLLDAVCTVINGTENKVIELVKEITNDKL